MRRTLRFALLLGLVVALPVEADHLAIVNPNQADFNQVARNVVAGFTYQPMGAPSSGVTGLSIDGFASFTPIRDKSAWYGLTGHHDDTLVVGGISADKGLPGGLDVGGYVAGVSDNDITLYGVRMGYALIRPGLILPSLVLSGHYNGASGIDGFDYHAYGADLTVAKSLVLLTPYAGVGYVWGKLSPDDGFGLHDVDVKRMRAFLGLRLTLLPLVHVGASYEHIASDNVYSVRLGLSI